MTSDFEQLATYYKTHPTPEEANYRWPGVHKKSCRHCRSAQNRTPEEKRPDFLWCRRLFTPKRLDNATNPENQTPGMWTSWDAGCDVWVSRYKW